MDKQKEKYNSNSGDVIIESQGNLLKMSLRTKGRLQVGGGTRGLITTFSKGSRKHMLEMLARLDGERLGFVSFVTLTYPDRNNAPSFEESTDNRKAFFKRLQRRFPDASGIWRREWEVRKTGDHAGELYPHFHVLFFNLPFVHHEEINRHWREVLKYGDYLRTEIKGVENWRQAFYYVAKYMAKPEIQEENAGFEPTAGFGRSEVCSCKNVGTALGATVLPRHEGDGCGEAGRCPTGNSSAHLSKELR